ncbi:hypothetical protein LJY25_02070 [Hymenobacter sp. BT175]|uniref:hypothetical protein n=1 Tax=Hymenobacter translucens TaxID=2886507 RepID=UPI001D0F31A7|nr:hypothetical protein [Hymenobacter translucens]MCC2545216.1 hypothetical protein [Hymenobacter translucens]
MQSILERERHADSELWQFLQLEKKWLKSVADRHVQVWLTSRSGDLEPQLQAQLRSQRRRILARIPAAELKLPDSRSPLTPDLQNFYTEIVNGARDAIQGSPYAKAMYIPWNLLPYPLNYTIFATEALVTGGLDTGFDARALLALLTSRVINVHSYCLPAEPEANEQTGLDYLHEARRG